MNRLFCRALMVFFIVLAYSAPFAGAGTYSGGTGDANTPYLIEEPNDIIEMSNTSDDWDRHFLMIADVNMIDHTFTTAVIAPDLPDTTSYFDGTPFTGAFDGNGYAILNLTIDTAGANNRYLGFFGESSGRLKNLCIEDCYIIVNDVSSSIGSLCGANDNGIITNCQVAVHIFCGHGIYFGGIVGHNYKGMISDSYATGSISGNDTSGFLGGVSGYNHDGTIFNCSANISIIGRGSSYYLGGLCGFNTGTISNCTAASNIEGEDYLGGLCGMTDSYDTISNCHTIANITGSYNSRYVGGLCGVSYCNLSNCSADGLIFGDSFLGGLVGWHGLSTITDCYANTAVTGREDCYYLGGLCGNITYHTEILNSYATGSVTGAGNYLGGLCGYSRESIISNCYATGDIIGDDYLGGLCGWNRGSISKCYSTGNVESNIEPDFLGGLCGYQSGEESEITNSFWDIVTSQMTVGYELDPNYPGTITNVFGKTTEQMQLLSTFINYGWDFAGEDVNGSDDIWRMCVDLVHYPKLWWQYSTLGDFDCPDGVGLEDILMLADYWLETELEPLQSPDATGDSKVNLDDFGITSGSWLGGI